MDRRIKVIGLLIDLADIAACRDWDTGKSLDERLNFPIVADTDCRVATLYGMIGEPTDPSPTVHSLFVLDRYRKVRLMRHCPPSDCRSFMEILRIVDSLQAADAEAKPALRARNNQTRSSPLCWAAGQALFLQRS
jgi:thioredoxin-dependent peroxiredoxin